tara:strand:+ start:1197 stop:1742 length:546 start_codon:yes stop_codon:yes gene_type:complete
MSTLHVENLKGLSSGGNANKIIVPSGQTLDASNGFTAPAGHVIQTVSATTADFDPRTTTTSTSYTTTGYTLDITPTSTSSKILIQFNIATGNTVNGQYNYFKIYRGSTPLGAEAAMGGSLHWSICYGATLDSPATTSATTYSIYFRSSNSSNTNYAGWSTFSSPSSPDQNMNSFVLQEIAG